MIILFLLLSVATTSIRGMASVQKATTALNSLTLSSVSSPTISERPAVIAPASSALLRRRAAKTKSTLSLLQLGAAVEEPKNYLTTGVMAQPVVAHSEIPAPDEEGCTPLHHAVFKFCFKQTDVAAARLQELLQKFSPLIGVADKEGRTPSAIAEFFGNVIAQLMIQESTVD